MVSLFLRRCAVLLCTAVLLLLMSTAPVLADVSVSDFSELKTAVSSGGTQVILVTSDITMSALDVPDGADITLKPSGTSVELSFAQCSGEKYGKAFITISSGGKLTISGNGSSVLTIHGSAVSGNAVPLIDNRGGTLVLESGAVVTNHISTEDYAGIKNKGSFIMNGGRIANCQGKTGGAVSVTEASGSFEMNGGEITGNSAEEGGGLFLSDGSTFRMNGGRISQNSGYDIVVRGGTPSATTISLSGDAEVSSIHLQNDIANGLSAPVMQIASGFSGTVSGISYTTVVSDTPFARFASAEEAAASQGQFTPASGKYQVSVKDAELFLTVKPAARIVPAVSSVTIIPGDAVRIPVSLEVIDTRVSSLVITALLQTESGVPVSDAVYSYAVKEGAPFAVAEQNTAGKLTLSTGTDIVADITDLFVLTVKNTESLSPGKYTVRFVMESSVSNAEDYTVYPQQTLDVPVSVIPLILAETSNTKQADAFGIGIWSFAQKASVTYVISPYSASLDKPWPTVSRNASPLYRDAETELADVSVYKSSTPYGSQNTWTAASSTVTRNNAGEICFSLSPADSDAQCFKLVFTGRKLGDVVEGSGDLNAVNLYDVDMILHAAVDKTRYIREDWRVYADVDSDGDIRLSDALSVFNFIKGY